MRPELASVTRSLDDLPVFPLPSAVLLPHELLPLHIFEPRYRAMIQDVVEGAGVLAIANLAPGWEGDYEGRPRLEPVCGAGVVARHEKLADGRWNILVHGIARVRITGEHPPRQPYRRVTAELVEDRITGPLDDEADSVRRMLFALCAARPGPGANALAQLASRAEDPSSLADIVCAALLSEHARRLRALLSVDVGARLRLAQTALAELLVTTSDAAAGLRN